MSDLNKMWAALEQYQPYADKAGHGRSWRRMTKERTSEAASAAWSKAAAAAHLTRSKARIRAAWYAASAAGAAATLTAEAAKTERRITQTIEHINQAMKEDKT